MLPSAVFLYALLGQATAAFPELMPMVTQAIGNAEALLDGFSPMPTALPMKHPRNLFARQNTASIPSNLCAYISADPQNRFTCYSSSFCGVQASASVVGCCNTYTLGTDGKNTPTSCRFQTTCYDSTAQSECTGTCSTDPSVAICGRSTAPYCLKYTITDATLSYFRCTSVSDATISAAYSFTTGGPTRSVSTSDNEPPPASTQSGATGGGNDSGQSASAVPTGAIGGGGGGGGGSTVGAAVGGAIGGLAVVLIAVGVGVWFWMKHKKHKRAEAKEKATLGAAVAAGSAGAGAGAGAAGAYYSNHQNNNNEYYSKAGDAGQAPNGHDSAPPYGSSPPYGSPELPAAYPFPITSPTSTSLSHQNSPLGSPFHPPPQEVEGTIPSAISPGPSAARLPPRDGTASPSMSGIDVQSDADPSELEGPSSIVSPTSGIGQPTSHFSGRPSSPGLSDAQSPVPHLGYTSGTPGDWNKPLHELPEFRNDPSKHPGGTGGV